MAGYFEEMGWRELEDGEQPDHLLHMARFIFEFGFNEDFNAREWPKLPPPASQETVKNLPETTIESDGKSCPICLKKFNIGEKVTEMPCNHQYHTTCISIWLNTTNSCPFCRYELPTDDEVYEQFKRNKKRSEQKQEDLAVLHNSMFS
ncbi:unnamed protein product [Arctia plantaginis]|uniref:RING-type E3 ubiquitin transferase n=1 Tax=Arctia plantaginis TaxID=874455 RepID=A0A8S1BRE8_ARCPL|nr:unnamed protein product [Arctia plantaginis]CAB3261760.1 unnamed protein product [Arctia plantaginis]